ncbi:LysR family transcriptional regulator [Burkholderiaceae bacterium DAT-1]|nr:LysR family transcriptional regulator [Burkholderiaceae bacterium DAT-1]
MQSLDTMALFALVVEAGSFTAAATQSGLPKSTVSQRIAELEAGLNLRLLHRTTRKLSLTDAGRTYLEYCQRVRDAALAGEAALSRLSGQPAGKLRITAPDITTQTLLPDVLAGFQQRWPHVTLEVFATDAHLDLIGEGIDLAIRMGRLEDSSFVSRRLGQVRRVLVASPAYLATHGTPSRPEDLALHACLVHPATAQWRYRSTAGEAGFPMPVPRQSSNSIAYLKQLAILGQGIAMLPAYLCEQALSDGALHVVLPDYALALSDYWLVYPSKAHASAALLALLQWLDECGLREKLG